MSISYKNISRKIKSGFLIYITLATLLILSLSIQEVNDAIFTKFQTGSETYGSTISRTASFIVPLFTSITNPFFGVGLSDYSFYFQKISLEIFGRSLNADGQSTNTYMSLTATYGWPIGIIFLYLTYKMSKTLTINKSTSILVFLLFSFLFSSQDSRYSLFFLTLSFVGFNRNNSYYNNKKY